MKSPLTICIVFNWSFTVAFHFSMKWCVPVFAITSGGLFIWVVTVTAILPDLGAEKNVSKGDQYGPEHSQPAFSRIVDCAS